jgi:hypothetical protein
MNIKQQSFILNSWEKTYMLANPYDKEKITYRATFKNLRALKKSLLLLTAKK